MQKKSTNYKAGIDPEIYKIKLYCIVIILYRMHTKKQKKHTPPKAAAIRLTLLLFPMCTKPRARYQNCNMACIQSQFFFRRPLPNLFKFELVVVCKVILIFKCILRLRKTSRQRKINIMECKWQILHHYSN